MDGEIPASYHNGKWSLLFKKQFWQFVIAKDHKELFVCLIVLAVCVDKESVIRGECVMDNLKRKPQSGFRFELCHVLDKMEFGLSCC